MVGNSAHLGQHQSPIGGPGVVVIMLPRDERAAARAATPDRRAIETKKPLKKLSFPRVYLARPTGLEPATSGSTVRCSNQLSYGPSSNMLIMFAATMGLYVRWHSPQGVLLDEIVPSDLPFARSFCLSGTIPTPVRDRTSLLAAQLIRRPPRGLDFRGLNAGCGKKGPMASRRQRQTQAPENFFHLTTGSAKRNDPCPRLATSSNTTPTKLGTT